MKDTSRTQQSISEARKVAMRDDSCAIKDNEQRKNKEQLEIKTKLGNIKQTFISCLINKLKMGERFKMSFEHEHGHDF